MKKKKHVKPLAKKKKKVDFSARFAAATVTASQTRKAGSAKAK